jgi:hypothetical protein
MELEPTSEDRAETAACVARSLAAAITPSRLLGLPTFLDVTHHVQKMQAQQACAVITAMKLHEVQTTGAPHLQQRDASHDPASSRWQATTAIRTRSPERVRRPTPHGVDVPTATSRN